MVKIPISIIIPTMNRPETLVNTIVSVISSDNIPNEIIIIDQSKDKVKVAEIKQEIESICGDICIKYITMMDASLTKARNLGCENCSNEIMVCMDDDIEVNKDTFKEIYNIMKDDNISMIAGIDELSEIGKSIGGYLFGKKYIFMKNKGYVTKAIFGRYPNKINNRIETQWAMGYFFVVKKSLVKKWKIKWDENLISYAYPEDLDFSYTYYKKSEINGYKCIIDPRIKVRHLCSKEYRIPSLKSTIMFVVNREYLSYKHFKSPFSRVMTRWANIGEIFNRIIKRESPMDLIKAQYYCDKYRKQIKSGEIPKFLYRENDI